MVHLLRGRVRVRDRGRGRGRGRIRGRVGGYGVAHEGVHLVRV